MFLEDKMAKLKVRKAGTEAETVSQYLKEKGLDTDVTTWTPAEVREFAAWVRFLKK